MMFILLAIAGVIAALLGARHLVSWVRFFILARKLPSPDHIPFIGNVAGMLGGFGDMERITKYFRQHPRCFAMWMGPIPVMFLRDPQDAQIIFVTGMKDLKKSIFYHFARQLMGDGLPVQEGEKWKQRRKLLNPGFHIKNLENSLQVLDRKSQILVQQLEKEVGQKSFNIQPYLSKATFDALNEGLLDGKSNCLDEEEHTILIKQTDEGTSHMMRRVLSPWLYPDLIYWNTSSGKICRQILDDVLEFSKKLLKNRREYELSKKTSVEDELLGENKKERVLDLLLGSSKYGVELSDMDIMEETRALIVAGFDTARTTLCWAAQVLGNHPDVQDKLHQEIENVLQGSDLPITLNDLNEMKYLESVIKEILRMYPPLPYLTRTSTNDLDIGGYTIPKGVLLVLSLYHLHRNPEFYPDPDKFDPERFLGESENRHPFAYIPFGSGIRNCIGQKFAMLKMKIILAYVIRNYKICAMREKLTPLMEIMLVSKEGFPVSIKKRNSNKAY